MYTSTGKSRGETRLRKVCGYQSQILTLIVCHPTPRSTTIPRILGRTMSDVFISYSRKDIAFARLLHQALNENELETWIDWQDIPPSADWLAEVYEAIEQTDTFIFIISPTSVNSEICSMEIAHASKHNKRLIPIVINDIDPQSVPSQLAALNWIFFREEDLDFRLAIQDLITAIQVDRAWAKEHTRYQN